MRKKISSFLLLFIVLWMTAMPTLAHTAEIPDAGADRYKAVRLTPDIYNNTDENLSGILLKDDQGEPVPYFINTSYQTVDSITERYPMNLINSFVKEDGFYYDYVLSQIPEHDVIATSIHFAVTGLDFAKKLQVLGSYDNIHWDMVQKDTIYNVDGNTKLEIVLNNPEKYTHYRFKLDNNLEKIAFDSVTLHYNTTISEQSYFMEEIKPVFHVEEDGKNTVIKMEGLKHLKLSEIVIKTNSNFKRLVSTLNTEKQIYNLTFGDTNYIDTAIALNREVCRDDTLEVVVYNNDDKPITIEEVAVKYVADEIVFEGKGQHYTLEFYNESERTSPVYDISSYKDKILQQPIDRLSIENVYILNESESESTEAIDYKLVFNLVIILIAVLLGWLILVKLKQKS